MIDIISYLDIIFTIYFVFSPEKSMIKFDNLISIEKRYLMDVRMIYRTKPQ